MTHHDALALVNAIEKFTLIFSVMMLGLIFTQMGRR